MDSNKPEKTDSNQPEHQKSGSHNNAGVKEQDGRKLTWKQRTIPAVILTSLGLIGCYISFTQNEAFNFQRPNLAEIDPNLALIVLVNVLKAPADNFFFFSSIVTLILGVVWPFIRPLLERKGATFLVRVGGTLATLGLSGSVINGTFFSPIQKDLNEIEDQNQHIIHILSEANLLSAKNNALLQQLNNNRTFPATSNISSLSSSLSELSNNISALNFSINEVKSEVSQLSSNLSAYSAQVESLEASNDKVAEHFENLNSLVVTNSEDHRQDNQTKAQPEQPSISNANLEDLVAIRQLVESQSEQINEKEARNILARTCHFLFGAFCRKKSDGH